MFERANLVSALENETTSELRANPPLLTTALFHFHYFYVLLTFERAARKKSTHFQGEITRNGDAISSDSRQNVFGPCV
jgi:hypothetical protein